ncbi:glycoside hydrolase family 10 [Ruminiclostridium cellulolyticum H10]|uniref:Beta-xylanase n=2 Tax=Ruminiclostridium cellulolyticum TaxID=1521 RepID=B8I4I7_RUMCH|nr:glycoside hydrolase family 10 [Ruminiclostridium cellulolyticum H10]
MLVELKNNPFSGRGIVMGIINDNKYSHRIVTKTAKLSGLDGSVLKNTEVVVQQTRHKFLFGCAQFDAIPYVNNEFKGEEKERAEQRFDKFIDLFNYATLPFYWAFYESVKGQPMIKETKKAAEWLVSNGLLLKGHTLCWHTITAPWLLDMTNEEILMAQMKRINRDVSEFEGLIDIWDAINEVVIMPVFDKYDNGITRICKELGRIKLVSKVFSEAKKANPSATLLINDFNTSESYAILLEGLIEAGVPIDAIGIQSHMHQGYWGVEKTLEVLERFSRFNLPLHFTENTLVSGQLIPPEIEDLNDYQVKEWPSTVAGEDRQAREVISHYKTLLANPKVESITWWDFADGAWLGAPSGFITVDNRVKPAYDELHKLIKGEWWLKPTKYMTNENGEITISGFFGDYEVSCQGKRIGFTFDSSNDTVKLKI